MYIVTQTTNEALTKKFMTATPRVSHSSIGLLVWVATSISGSDKDGSS